MRFHLIGLPHTNVTREYVACSYTQKHLKFTQMMLSLGHEVFSYASEDNDVECTENIVINTKKSQKRWFGEFDYHNNFFPITWEPSDIHWKESNHMAKRQLRERVKPGDFICIIAGYCQEEIAKAFPNNPVVEYGIGYVGAFASYRVYESYAHMHYVHGFNQNDNGRAYDAVIPNYFDPNDFTFSNEKEDYYVFLGRFIERKGVEIAVEATRKLGAKLIMAGQGCTQVGNTFYGDGVKVEGDHLEHIGHVNVEERAELLSKAKACFMPTTYLEPFGGVSIEALFSGTPVIASDWGCFTETIPHGEAGYRFHTVGEAAYYASDEMLSRLNNKAIAEYAYDNYSMDVVRYKYEDYFRQVQGLYDGSGNDFFSDLHGRDDRFTHQMRSLQVPLSLNVPTLTEIRGQTKDSLQE